MSRTRPIWSRTGALTTTPSVIALPNMCNELKIYVDGRCYGQLGGTYAAPAVAAVNGVTTLSSGGGATGGTFLIQVFPKPVTVTDPNGAIAVTAAIPYNETAANIKTALVATGYFASGDITAAGGALPTSVPLTWTGAYAGTVPPIAVVSSVTGGVNSAIVARTTTQPIGNGGYGYLEGGTQEGWDLDPFGGKERFLYLASVGASANYFVTALL